MKLRFLPIFLFPLFATPLQADTFGSGLNQFTVDFVTIGKAGNADDDTGYGAVDYTYRMGAYEVSRGMIDAYNALGGGPVLMMADMTSYGGNGSNRPATGTSWNEAARFVNWLNTSKGHSAAYKFTTGGADDNIALWTSGDIGYDAANPFRNANAYYFLPSEDEWYKAAYYDPYANTGLGGYWNYATGRDNAPTAVASGTTSGTAVYNQLSGRGPADITNAGGLSPHGTMAQIGNALEWIESEYTAPNDSPDGARLLRGGHWYSDSLGISQPTRVIGSPGNESFIAGFRVASVIPEPSGALLAAFGVMGFVLKRSR